MEVRFQNSPEAVAGMHTDELREHFLCKALMQDDKIRLIYSHYDRVIIGGIKPVTAAVALPNHPELKADYFLQRREAGIINVGGTGEIITEDNTFTLNKLDCLYLGKETKTVTFKSYDQSNPALFYFLSAPAHHKYASLKMTKEEAAPVSLGEQTTSNKRTIYKYIHNNGIPSCQLVMGLTILEEGSVWNSVPPHTHTRRMEAYFYFDIPASQRVFHCMGEPQQTRHVVVENHEAIISPPWSVHFGCGTSSYGFIWGMAGENKEFTDMDGVPVADLL
ncbi:5-dehydro-4-deoxy-D-glucuronate isomerase [Ilyomonas limi]|uniref:4-deoxy-L-threo-5-hexosulose-uronate ketol-isomerase n=1 Tax=Ilyomonas limi TaxID=2575867 RepID=A0A4U3KXK5_9BACT|nr:5-dehydro-4-deoxy-D-glucuronate isomerase [Ilyomonas limi]TKK65827.1 5-dehydro-4-deoxy-D-glucuronate isomerase [Ilyomonas limi]